MPDVFATSIAAAVRQVTLLNLRQHGFDVSGRGFILDSYANSGELFLHLA
jgi:hypothetical protein